MSKTVNLGGDRLGSGAKNNISLHNYNRSTHDLSHAWRSSMNVGTLVPFLKLVGLPGDTFSIDLESRVRTIPTIGPLYGSYKLQLDIFECPIRLYNGLLHNNMTKIGLNMSQVKLPKIKLSAKIKNPSDYTENTKQIANSSLVKYLGISGIGDVKFNKTSLCNIERKFNGVPYLAYWDIYKNYYANKQEEKGVMIHHTLTQKDSVFIKIGNWFTYYTDKNHWHQKFKESRFGELEDANQSPVTITGNSYQACQPIIINENTFWQIFADGTIENSNTQLIILEEKTSTITAENISDVFSSWVVEENGKINLGYPIIYSTPLATYKVIGIGFKSEKTVESERTKLKTFDLENIDNARIAILQNTGLNNELIINNTINWTPYIEPISVDVIEEKSMSRFEQEGLGIKTYQSDLLNNWLETEWIDGTNGINQITAIDVSSGSFTIDALNLANKVYNMLNRVAVSGGSYEDWQEAVYTTEALRRAETPVYKGGMAAEIMFDEVISNAATDDQPLGTIAGRGIEVEKRGGHIEISVTEPSYIIGIVSITPRLDYCQGNDWDMSELDTLDDLHKPALDGIGFEDLLQERAAWFGTYYDETLGEWKKLAMGKVPAWINYMTAINKTFGDFCENEKAMWMTLNRQYEQYDAQAGVGKLLFGIRDLTTYIDPAKYNYAFADSTLDSQNFWVQIGMRIEARRVMSAKIIPNL